MLIDSKSTIAYNCPHCGIICFKDLSLFVFSGKKQLSFSCKCGKSKLEIINKNYKKYEFSIPCSECGDIHNYSIGIRKLWSKELNISKCSKYGVDICIAGQKEDVFKHLDSLEFKKDMHAGKMGYKKYFSNSLVMLEAFNKIHEIAEKNKIYCECGSHNIYFRLLFDRINVKCFECGGVEVIYIKNSFDLQKIHQKDEIYLYKKMQHV